MKQGPVAQTGLRRRTLIKDGAQASEAGDPGFKSPRARQYLKKTNRHYVDFIQRQKIMSIYVFKIGRIHLFFILS